MAALGFAVVTPSGGVAVTNDGNPHTLLQVTAPASQRSKLRSFTFSCKGVVVTDPPIRVRVLKQTTAGTLTNVNTPVKLDSSVSESINTTAKDTATVEPTASDVIWEGFVHPQSSIGFQFPISYEPILGGGQRIGFEALVAAAGAAATIHVAAHFEE